MWLRERVRGRFQQLNMYLHLHRTIQLLLTTVLIVDLHSLVAAQTNPLLRIDAHAHNSCGTIHPSSKAGTILILFITLWLYVLMSTNCAK
jgi:hypothetical protein